MVVARMLGINSITEFKRQQSHFIYIKQAFISILKTNTQDFLIHYALDDPTVSDMRLNRPT